MNKSLSSTARCLLVLLSMCVYAIAIVVVTTFWGIYFSKDTLLEYNLTLQTYFVEQILFEKRQIWHALGP